MGNIQVRLGNELAVLVGCLDINSQQRLDCLRFSSNTLSKLRRDLLVCCRNVSAWELAKADFEDGVISMPVDDHSWSSQPFFPKPPEEAFKDGHFDTSVSCLETENISHCTGNYTLGWCPKKIVGCLHF